MTLAAVVRLPVAPAGPYPRYVPAKLSGALRWGIWDRTEGAWCALADGGVFIPLEWQARQDAEVWLYLCRLAWRSGLVDAPDGWNGY